MMGIEKRCELLNDNKNVLRSVFTLDNNLMILAGAAVLAGMGAAADVVKIREARELLRGKKGVFSNFRGNLRIPLICVMSIQPDPEAYLDSVTEVMDSIKVGKLVGSDYRLTAAMTLRAHADTPKAVALVETTERIYASMKKAHPWLTSSEDLPLAALLAGSGAQDYLIAEEAETLYGLLKKRFHDSDSVQALSHVLSLGSGEAARKAEKLIAIHDELKRSRHPFTKGKGLAVLGTLSFIDKPADELARLVIEADDCLKSFKGFGNFTLGGRERRLFAAQAVIAECAPDDSTASDLILSSMLSITITAQVYTMVAVSSAASS